MSDLAGNRSTLPNFHTIKDVADAFGVSERTVRRWIKKRLLGCHRAGGVIRISGNDLRAFMRATRVG